VKGKEKPTEAGKQQGYNRKKHAASAIHNKNTTAG
jgi:hypothetical protein